MAILTGGACIGGDRCATLASGLRWSHEGMGDLYRTMKERGILEGSVKNFGRFDIRSKAACLAAGLTLHDASIPANVPGNDVGILSAMPGGALEACREYFRDYLDCGRTLGRGNLFIYTLPTSPLAETAICYGLGGPLAYVAGGARGAALEQAAAAVDGREAEAMLVVLSREDEYACLALQREGKEAAGVDEIAAALDRSDELMSLVQR
jgi:hypothetical protein